MKKWINFKNPEVRLILMLAALFTVIRILTGLSMYYREVMAGTPLIPNNFIQGRLIAWAVAMLYIVVIVKTTKLFLFRKKSWVLIISIQLLIALAISFLWYCTFLLANMAIEYSRGTEIEEEPKINFFLWYLQNFDALLIVILFTISLTYTYYYIQRNSLQQIQKSQIEQQLLQARLTVLKSQLQPHFLFNTLNSIASIMTSDLTRARDMLVDLSDLLRHVLDSGDRQTVSLQEELAILHKYLDIEKTRFSEQLSIELNVGDKLSQAIVPNMLLQPIVENAINHGYSKKHPTLEVAIDIFSKDQNIILIVKDNGRGFPSESISELTNKGMGLKNTYKRLQTIYGDSNRLSIRNLYPGAEVRIVLPLKYAEATLM